MDEIDRGTEVGNVESVRDIRSDDPFEILLDKLSFEKYEDPFCSLIDRFEVGIIGLFERERICECITHEDVISTDYRDHDLIYE